MKTLLYVMLSGYFCGHVHYTTPIRCEECLLKNEIESKTMVQFTEDDCRVRKEDFGVTHFL